MKGGRTPRWAKSPDDVQEYITKAHAQCTSANSILRSGGSIHIGIIDSACRLPSHLTNRHTINGGDDHSFIDDDEDDTTRHGTAVFRRISAFAPEAKVSLYQAVRDDRKLPIEAYSGAVTQAIKDDVDILNLSAGVPWRHPVHLNPLVMETNRLINAGITVVAAAGNHFPGRTNDRRFTVHQLQKMPSLSVVWWSSVHMIQGMNRPLNPKVRIIGSLTTPGFAPRYRPISASIVANWDVLTGLIVRTIVNHNRGI